MIVYTHYLGGEEVRIHVPETDDDLDGFFAFLARGDKVLGADTETTGLRVFSPGFGVRLAQFGNRTESWVLRRDRFPEAIRAALGQDRRFVFHNYPFDGLALDRDLGLRIEDLGPKCFDTKILAHLLDPRMKSEGGVGLRLKELAEVYVADDAPDTEGGLSTLFSALFADWKKTASQEAVEEFKVLNPKRPHMAFGFANVPIDNELYLRYAGLDPILARRLFDEVGALVHGIELDHLSVFEHHLQILTMLMQRRGMLVDVDYTERLVEDLTQDEARYALIAKRYGVENVNSTAQVSTALLGMGETLRERTPSGEWKVDKSVLMALADIDNQWEPIESRRPNPLADAVLHSKRAGKWRKSYAETILSLRDSASRIHPTINALQARTGRMSVSNPPFQQLPRRDWTIRRAIVADPGQLLVSSDYSQIEMRVLAALCRDERLMEAILSGKDLHDFTADLVFGPDFTKAQRSLSKAVGFGKVYGGGATTIQRETGAPLAAVREAIAAYDSTYPGVKKFGRRLMNRAEFGKKEVVTPSGRHLPLDKDRLYAATNFVCQSTARDILAQAIVDLHDAGLGDYLLLPIHDEILAQVPAAEADEIAREIGRVMDGDFMGLPIVSEPEVYGWNWGLGYGGPNEPRP